MIVGFTCGAFDLLHAGHIHFLTTARSQCDSLIVGLHTNPKTDRATKNAPVQTMYERWMQLHALRVVDIIIPYDTEADLRNLLATQPMHRRFLGNEYRDSAATITGTDICKALGIGLVFLPRLHGFSSTELRGRVYTHAKKES